ncbi:MAG: DNA adenine methylase [Oscillospiraceae bacterium]|nr:DNA adenine methylase [Oscillospiraceae bacterium]
MTKNKLVMPVLKWVGGKRQLLPEIQKYKPKTITAYYEPFVGGGAVLFALQPKKAVINDINSDLINVYNVIKDNVEELINELDNKEKYLNNAECFYSIREIDRESNKFDKLTKIEKAARVIYLNKTCYNGLYRVNSAGKFNSPFGSYKNPNIVNSEVLRAVSNYFNRAEITFLNGDFANTVEKINKGAFVYFDPPYAPISKTSNFTGYSEGGFGEAEQIRLKELCDELNQKGVKFLLSNSDCEFIRELYKDYEIIEIKAKRSINSNANRRGEVSEVLIRNYGKM